MESSPRPEPKPSDQEGQAKGETKQGGWITLPFIAGSMLGLGLAINGTTSNLQIYLIKQYNVDSIDAAQIANIVRGSLNFVPVAGAILSDSYLGCFPVILAGAAINVLVLLCVVHSLSGIAVLRPPHCPAPSAACQRGTPEQLAVLYAAASLLAIGTGGRFGGEREQDTFFNWYFVFLSASFLVGDTAIVYIQDGVSWAWASASASPRRRSVWPCFSLARGTTGCPRQRAAVLRAGPRRRGRRAQGSRPCRRSGSCAVLRGDNAVAGSAGEGAPSKRLSFLNRAAMITATDNPMGDASGGRRPSGWRLCKVQQVEDLKSVLGVFPLWSSGIMISVSIGVMIGMIILQALAMDRSLGPRFKIPAGSITVCSLVAFIAITPVLDRAVFPLWRRITGMPPSPLQRVGLGHVVNITGMVVAALVERRRLSVVHAHDGADGEAGWVTPYVAELGGHGAAAHRHGFYLSTVFVDVVRRVTAWLPENINQARLDNVYWTLAVAVTVNWLFPHLCQPISVSKPIDHHGNVNGEHFGSTN
ncbi:hypothetical protein ZWY2020_011367 [Hordeum vulgare]|nr:hypothetical protein ZWY2020_011367 [Hordeum vulgare]